MKPKLNIWMPDVTFTPIWTPEVLWEQRHHVFLSRFLFALEKVFLSRKFQGQFADDRQLSEKVKSAVVPRGKLCMCPKMGNNVHSPTEHPLEAILRTPR